MNLRFKKDDELLPVIKPMTGQKYRVAWGRSRGVVGMCIEVNEQNQTVILRKPSSKQRFKYPVKWSELRHTRINQIKNPH